MKERKRSRGERDGWMQVAFNWFWDVELGLGAAAHEQDTQTPESGRDAGMLRSQKMMLCLSGPMGNPSLRPDSWRLHAKYAVGGRKSRRRIVKWEIRLEGGRGVEVGPAGSCLGPLRDSSEGVCLVWPSQESPKLLAPPQDRNNWKPFKQRTQGQMCKTE
jgi:hypothetical protein